MAEEEKIEAAESTEETNDAEKAQRPARSGYFYIPDISLFTEGNDYIASKNTFNYKMVPEDGELKVYIWYGMKCFELSEPVTVLTAAVSDEGQTELAHSIDKEYEKYVKLVESGEVPGRRTYREVEEKKK